MSEVTRVYCDFCGKMLSSNGEVLCNNYKTEFESIRISYVWNGSQTDMDICPKCLKKLRKQLKRNEE